MGVLVGLVVITGAVTVGIALASRRAIATAHRMVTAHGGTIRAEPRAGGGTRFVVDLPQVLVKEKGTDGARETDSPRGR